MKKLFFMILILALLVVGSPVMAQTNDLTQTTNLELPSDFGLWWQELKETISLGLTFDPVKKAEKALNYAENRMELAERFASRVNKPETQEKAEAMIEKAQSFMRKIESNQNRWIMADEEEKKTRLMKNLADYQVQKEEMLNRMEENLNEEQKDRFNELREKGLEISGRLMNALENDNIPEEVQTQLGDIKLRIEAHAAQIKNYIETRKELREKIKSGNQEAIEELKNLNEQRREEMKAGVKNMMQNQEQIREKVQEAGEAMRIQIQNRVQDMDPEMMEERREEAENRIQNQIENNEEAEMMMDRLNNMEQNSRRK